MSTSANDVPAAIAAEEREADRFAGMLREMVVEMVSSEGPDLSVRQLGVLLACYLDANVVRTTSFLLGVLRGSRRGINRALARLEECALVRLEFESQAPSDPAVHPTALGRAYIERILEAPGQPAGDGRASFHDR